MADETLLDLQDKLSKENASLAAPLHPTPAPVAARSYCTVNSFSWDEDGDKVKIYLPLVGVEEEKMEKIIEQNSVELKFHDVQGKNYQFVIPKLHQIVVPEQCKVMIKPTRVIVTLAKGSKGYWLDLHRKEDMPNKDLDEERGPMAGMMDFMKSMYAEGDEETRKRIIEAWTQAESGETVMF